jgi:hypothetical protein
MSKEQQDNQPQPITLTTISLVKYTIMSIAFAIFILFTIVLPAEYNIDPTGIGKKLGLTVFNEVTNTSTTFASSPLSSLESLEKTADITKNISKVINVTVPAGRGVEYKFTMQQYQKLTYQWQTDSTALYFDLHGEPEGDTTGYFESYAIATLQTMEGSFTAPFSGVHGWYWKNASDKPVKVQLTVKGEYSQHGLK